jgi:LuxR family maltose regulon positive regulatory protein
MLEKQRTDEPLPQPDQQLLKRDRIDQLLTRALLSCFIVVVTAGAGYGKTRAVNGFLRRRGEDRLAMQLSERDNLPARFWENFTHTVGRYNPQLGARLVSLGFPSISLMEQYREIVEDELSRAKGYILALDDFHNLTNPEVLGFFNAAIARPHGKISLIIVSRTEPALNLMPSIMKGQVAFITEDELRFTRQETSDFFKKIGVSLTADTLAAVCADTDGWAFSVNLVGMSLTKANNARYVRSAMKSNVFKLMDAEVFSVASPRLQHFLVRLSLIEFLSVDLVRALAGDEGLIAELAAACSFIRYDSYLDAYRIHRLLLDFLAKRQGMLSEEEKRETWHTAARWCMDNGHKIDAVAYFEKAGDYAGIADFITHGFPQQIPPASAQFLLRVFEDAPPGAFEGVLIHPVLHMRILLSLSRIEDAVALAQKVVRAYEAMPVSRASCRVLCSAYIALAVASWMRAPVTDVYDFDYFFERDSHYFKLFPYEFSGAAASQTVSAYASMVGTARAGAFEEYLGAMERSAPIATACLNGNMAGLDTLAAGELLFYKADLKSAEIKLKTAFAEAEKHRQHDIRNRALSYLLRIYLASGKYESASWAIKQLEAQLSREAYHERQLTYDIVIGRYYILIGSTDFVASWLGEEIEESAFGEYVMDFANLMKALLLYTGERYEELLNFAQSETRVKRFLLGRIELKVLEALCHYQMNNRAPAFEALECAYRLSQSNGFLMPFVEQGKHMRTLTAAARKSGLRAIPDDWLDDVNQRASVYAKRLNLVAGEYRNANGLSGDARLSALESKVLGALVDGLSRSEIAAQLNLSINTVKTVINMVYLKLGAKGSAEAIRIAVERKLL